jgi:hypothetical protein
MVPEVRRDDGSGVAHSAQGRPQTLGDVLNDVMRQRVHTTEAAAKEMEAKPSEVLAWSADEDQPDRSKQDALIASLDVDEEELRALVLRGQMRRAQERIRN